MFIIRTLLNNGFFILLLIILAIIFIAYPDTIKKDNDLLSTNETEKTVDLAENEQISATEPVTKKIVADVELPKTKDPTLEEIEPSSISQEMVIEPETIEVEVIETEVIEPKNKETNTQITEKIKANKEELNNLDFATAIDKNINVEEVLSRYRSFDEAINAARSAEKIEDAKIIYYSLAAKVPSAMVLGEFGNVLFHAGKKDLAELAWIEAGRILVKENKINEAVDFAKRLKNVSSNAADAILKEVAEVTNNQQKVLATEQ